MLSKAGVLISGRQDISTYTRHPILRLPDVVKLRDLARLHHHHLAPSRPPPSGSLERDADMIPRLGHASGRCFIVLGHPSTLVVWQDTSQFWKQTFQRRENQQRP